MSRQLYDFRCTEGHVSEHFVDLTLSPAVPCGICGAESKRLISPVRCKLEGVTGDFPGAALTWERKREEQIRYEQRTRSDSGESP